MNARIRQVLAYGLLGLVYLFILGPILVILPASFAAGRAFTFPPEHWTLEWWLRVVQDQRLLGSLWLSLRIGAVASVGAVLVGAAAALGLERGRFPMREWIVQFFLGPLILPLVVTGLALLTFFGSLGWVATWQGIVIAHIVLTTPYVVRTVLASLETFDAAQEEAAWVHGAAPWRAFWTVVLPQIRPGLIAGGMFAFLISLDEFTVTIFLSGPGFVTLPIRIFQYLTMDVDPTVSALASAVVLVSTVLLFWGERRIGLHKYLEM